MARRLRGPEPIDLDRLERGERADLAVPIYENALGVAQMLPIIALVGAEPGPTVGICAALHGDELNGIRIIHELAASLDLTAMRGAVLCAPVANVPAFLARQRKFPEDGIDLNHVFPGSKSGTQSQQYARAFLDTFMPACNYLIDIHTASEGRVNTMYVRVDFENPVARRMAELMRPQIILHGKSGDGTLRSAARRAGVPAITVEAGNPAEFQGRMVLEGESGVRRVLADLGLHDFDEDDGAAPVEPVICADSRWLRTRRGGLLDLPFALGERVAKGRVLAEVRDIYGRLVETYRAPSDGIVIGKARSPLSVPGTRFCHLGRPGRPGAPKS